MPSSTERPYTYNTSQVALKQMFQLMQSLPGCIASEVTFTFHPGRVDDVQNLKKNCMKIVAERILRSKYIVGFILTRENHANGFPHIHGIVWYPWDHNNAKTLIEGRIFVPSSKNPRINSHYLFNELGKIQVDKLRTEPYVNKKGEVYDSWFEYILKDQEVNWKIKNCVSTLDIKLEYYNEPKIPEFID